MRVDCTCDFVPRPWQKSFINGIGNRKRAFLLWARRHGKDIACWNYLWQKAKYTPGAYYYLYPRQNQARKAIWEGMTSTGKKFLDYIPKELLAREPNNTEMALTLINGSIIRILGSDNYDSLRSSNPMGVVFSEFAWHHPETWPAVIEPIMRENKGWALFNTTPFGRNHAFDLWEYAVKHPEAWYTEKVTNNDSHLITPEQFQEMRDRNVSDDIIQGEYYCDWNRGVEGAYYAKIINQLKLDGKIKSVAKDDYAQVYTAWDLGFGDSTAILFYQICGNEIHVIDFYENHGEGLPHYIHVLEDKAKELKYKYATHFVPHDASAGSLGLGSSLVIYAQELGVKFHVLPRENDINLGIERVRKYLPRCYIDDKKCQHALKCFESYRKRYNEDLKVYSDTPLHDYTSHASDALRYMCQAVELFTGDNRLTLEEYRALKKQYGHYGPEDN